MWKMNQFKVRHDFSLTNLWIFIRSSTDQDLELFDSARNVIFITILLKTQKIQTHGFINDARHNDFYMPERKCVMWQCLLGQE